MADAEPLVFELDREAEWVGSEEEFKGHSLSRLLGQLGYVLEDLELMESRPDWSPSVEWAACLRNQRYWLLREIERRRA